ncbi:uncharacterized protein BROUX77_006394 [Berkeleyomyces rouxiae]|uniref:uncharacterized protein n=1 Tax=Berkeleyomyces rouxiae TaxID=2035830 RepID=UPI003B806AF2
MPGTKRADIESDTIQNHLPSELQYACLYWVGHMQNGEILLDNISDVLQFFREHFLHWLEAMSLMGRASETLKMLRTLQAILKAQESHDLRAFLQDALRLVRANMATITDTPLQIYSSVLAFSPKKSLVRRIFEQKIARWISVKPQTNNDWDQCEQILEGHTGSVHSVVFSPDGSLVASGSWDTMVRLWRTDDGTCVQQLQGHTKRVNSVAFSPDGRLVASGSWDTTIRLWRIDDDTCFQELKGHASSVNSVAFSPDGTLVASGSGDYTARFWKTSDGTCAHELK